MTLLSDPFVGLPRIIVFGVLATVAVPLLAFVWLAVFLLVALAAVVALGWGVVAALRAVGGRLWWRPLQTANQPFDRKEAS
jgi:hypothetical protein